MAGGHDVVKLDPAVERWNYMREDAYRHFRFTNRSTIAAIVGLIAIPGALYYTFNNLHYKYSWTGAKKGEPLTAAARSQS